MSRRINSAHVLALVAVFISLGGAAWALKTNTVKSRHIVDGQVKPPDLSAGARSQWALVKADGEILRQSGGISVAGQNEGEYVIDFGRPIAKRGLVATISYESAVDMASVHVSPCGDDGDNLRAKCDAVAPGADASGRHALVFTQNTPGSGGDPQPFWVATLPR